MKKLCALLIYVVICTMLCGCSGTVRQEPVSGTVWAMDTVMTFTVYGEETALDGCFELVDKLEKLLSVTDSKSEISLLNQNGTAHLSPETEELIKASLEKCTETDGCLDISIYPVLKQWGFTADSFQIPDSITLESLRPLVDYRQVTVSDGVAAFTKQGMEIDLGSVAKGYTADKLIKYLEACGVKSALINLGGNVQTLGTKPDGSAWRVAIASPDGTGLTGYVETSGKAVVTSGDYQRCFEKDGKLYHHIIDPQTLYPAEGGIRSITIISDSGFESDALSTALFVMGIDGACKYYLSHGGFDMIIIDTNGQVMITKGLKDSYTPLNGKTPVLIQ